MPPAARVGDMHTCPMVNPGPVPHVGGPVLPPGCPTVLIGMMPAARIGDMAVCVGPPDVIAKGSPTVLIGMMPAARIGDNTAHGGVIIVGCPTVMIGDSGGGGGGGGGLVSGTAADAFGVVAVTALAVAATAGVLLALSQSKNESYAKGITISGSDEFRRKTRESLDRLAATPTGKALLESIGKSGKQVTITEFAENNGQCRALTDKANRKPDGSDNEGSDSDVRFNPDFKPGGLPNEVILGHELMHADHNAWGTRESGTTAGTKNEELKTMGLPPFPETGTTENCLRRDLGLSQRTSY